MFKLGRRPTILAAWALSSALSLAVSTAALAADAVCGKPPNTATNDIRWVTYLLSKPQDAAQCSMEVVNGKIVVKAPTSNPAMTCPDMFSWKLFAEAVKDEFWKKWAADQETWPGVSCGPGDSPCQSRPLPICSPQIVGGQCCNPYAQNNPGYNDPRNPAKYCPFFPGDHLSSFPSGMPERLGVAPSKAHTVSFAADPFMRTRLTEETPGRKIRQSMAEIVFRNKPMFDYVFRNNLYTQEGVIDVFRRNASNIGTGASSGAPYRVANGNKALSEIDFPSSSVMIKSDWISKERAAQMGLKDDPKNPYIKMNITSPVTDNNGTILEPGEHWLVAAHFSSKDIPNWVWTTFEHVNNPGRCDYTGCNDSYGYRSPDPVPKQLATNYTSPKLKCDNLPLPSWVFDLGKAYDGGTINDDLAAVFRGMGIGRDDNPTLVPKFSDRAWLSYRLKGSQVNFSDSMGRPVHLGNSVTEGGFVTTSSCMTCHARAGTSGTGTVPLALGVFVNGLTESGYLPGSRGLPLPDWFHKSGQPPALTVLQTDFVWGFLTANCSTPGCQPPTPVASTGADTMPVGAPAPAPAAPPALPSARERAKRR